MTGTAHKVRRDGFTFTNALGQRDTLSATVASDDGSFMPEPGAAVLLNDTVLGDLFGGNIRQLRADLQGIALVSQIGCASWEQLFDRRTTGARQYRDTPAGDVFDDLITNTMGSEGITSSVSVAGPNITLDLDFQSVREAFDKICELASDAIDTYMWDCLPDRTARFYRQSSFAAPFDCTSANDDIERPITASFSLDDYANRVYVRMGAYRRPVETQSFVGDGSNKVFTVDFPLADTPVITVGGASQTVGVLDAETGKQWYYRLGSQDVIQDAGETPPGVGVAVDVEYAGTDSRVLDAIQDNTEVDARSAAEGFGGTGYYVAVISLDTIGGSTDAAAAAQAYLDAHARIPASVEYMTMLGGLRAGMHQTVTLPAFGVSATYIIQSATLSFDGGRFVWRIKAVSGALIPTYVSRLRALTGGSTAITGSASGGGTSTASLTDAIVVVTADTTLGVGPELVEVDTSGGDVTVTLPAATSMIGLRKTIYKSTGDVNIVTIEGAGSETIDGSLNVTLTDQWETLAIEGVDATSWKVVANAVSVSASAPPAPGDFTVGTLTYQWVESVGGGTSGKPQRNAKLRVFIPVTPPGTMGVTKGGHLYLEAPDQSTDPSAPLDGSVPLDGTATLQGNWSTVDLGKFPYVADQQPFFVDLDLQVDAALDIRIYVSSYSDQIDTPLVQAGKPGASPSAVLTINPFVAGKPASGSNRTTLLVTAITQSVAAVVSANGKLYRPISITVDLTGLPATRPANWAYQLLGFKDNDLTSSPVLVSGLYRTDGLAGAGEDDITAPHTFGPDEPTEVWNVTVYAVAGLTSESTDTAVGDGRGHAGAWRPNRIVPGITASVTVTYGTLTGVLDPTKAIAALLGPAMGVVNAVFDVVPQGIDNARIALLAVDTAKLAALAVTAAKLGNSSVTATAIANLAVGTAAIQTAAITTALIANAAITNALIANLAVGTAQIQLLAVGSAQISSLDVTKLNAGTISVAISLTAPDITATNASFVAKINVTDGFKITGNTLTTQLNNSNDPTSNPAGLIVYTTSGGLLPVSIGPGLVRINESLSGTPRWDIQVTGAFTSMRFRTPGGAATYTISTASGLLLPGWTVDVSGNAQFNSATHANGFTGTLAAAISAGKNVVGGVILN